MTNLQDINSLNNQIVNSWITESDDYKFTKSASKNIVSNSCQKLSEINDHQYLSQNKHFENNQSIDKQKSNHSKKYHEKQKKKKNYVDNKGLLLVEEFSGLDNEKIQLQFDKSDQKWKASDISIKFANVIFYNVHIAVDDNLHVSGDSMLGGIDLTFEYIEDIKAFVSEEDINIIHIATGFAFTLSDFILTSFCEMKAFLHNSFFSKYDNNLIQLKYDEKNDIWTSLSKESIYFGRYLLKDAIIILDDYDLIVKARLEFTDNIIELTLGNSTKHGAYLYNQNANIKISNNLFDAKIKITQSGNIDASILVRSRGSNVELEYKNGIFFKKYKETKKFKAPEKGYFENDQYYRIDETVEYKLDITKKQIEINPINITITNPYVISYQQNNTNYKSATLKLESENNNGKYIAKIDQQTVRYIGKAGDGFLGDYKYEEGKRYEYEPEKCQLKVGSRYIKGHGSIFYKTVYNYYYKNYEKYSKYVGVWPFRSLTYDYYYQILSIDKQ